MHKLTIAFSITGFLLSSSGAFADCSDAVSTYNSALSDIENYAKRYFRCVADSNGLDDCSSEFRKLKNAQSDFESAVLSYQSDCNR